MGRSVGEPSEVDDHAIPDIRDPPIPNPIIMNTVRSLLSVAFASVLSVSAFAGECAVKAEACAKPVSCCVKAEDGTKTCTAADKAACCNEDGTCKAKADCKVKCDKVAGEAKGECPIAAGCEKKAACEEKTACPETKNAETAAATEKTDGCCAGAVGKAS